MFYVDKPLSGNLFGDFRHGSGLQSEPPSSSLCMYVLPNWAPQSWMTAMLSGATAWLDRVMVLIWAMVAWWELFARYCRRSVTGAETKGDAALSSKKWHEKAGLREPERVLIGLTYTILPVNFYEPSAHVTVTVSDDADSFRCNLPCRLIPGSCQVGKGKHFDPPHIRLTFIIWSKQ